MSRIRLSGYTEMWGVCERIEKTEDKELRATLRVSKDRTLSVSISEKKAKELASCRKARLRGIGVWDETCELLGFQVEEIEPIKTPDKERIETIRKKLGKCWRNSDTEIEKLRAD